MLPCSDKCWHKTLVTVKRVLARQGHAHLVAGCGTNQAVFTALKFPNATVVWPDLSGPSSNSPRISEEILAFRIDMRRESLNEVAYDQEFDMYLHRRYSPQCGPGSAASQLATAFERSASWSDVYNRYHRTSQPLFKCDRILSVARRTFATVPIERE